MKLIIENVEYTTNGFLNGRTCAVCAAPATVCHMVAGGDSGWVDDFCVDIPIKDEPKFYCSHHAENRIEL